MPNIKNISSLRQYTTVLDEVEKGNPVFLMREGKGKYAILDLEEYDSMRQALWGRLIDDLEDARRQGSEQGWVSMTAVRAHFNIDDQA